MKRDHIFDHYEEDACRFWKLQEGGYATPMSVRPGESVFLHISNSRSYYDVSIYRDGARRELAKKLQGFEGALHPVPEFGYRDGFDWPTTVEFEIPSDWVSGVYIASFPTGQGPREILLSCVPPSRRRRSC